jgi:glyoxylase-like metal-dependent hydrolase (beta-lactamase superfamily II)
MTLHYSHFRRSLNRLLVASALVLPFWSAHSLAAQSTSPEVRLYTMDCGRLDFKDMALFSDTGEYEGKPGSVVVPCYLIKHPNGWLIWDTGLGDKVFDQPDHSMSPTNGIKMTVTHRIVDQLAQLQLKPEDINYVAFSHFHFDHTGNANLFNKATWIINTNELNWITSSSAPPTANLESFNLYTQVKTQMITSDYDVFGDGSVRIIKTPGHTPGHQSLMLQLKKKGTVILSGDLYHLRQNREHSRVPTINTSRSDTLASMNRAENISKNKKAHFIIQHEEADFKSAPKFPAYMD